jgi:hypothetical protein
VDNTFIDCSVETQSKANHCTVYKGSTGEILADGLFLLNTSMSAASLSELRYAAFGHGVIYLEDARTLRPWRPSESDPANRITTDRLKALAGNVPTQPIDCGPATTDETPHTASDCALKAFAESKPFYLRHYRQGLDSITFNGFAGDAKGNVYEVDYDSTGWMNTGLPKDVQVLDDNHTIVIPCSKPAPLKESPDGTFICMRPSHVVQE